MVQLCASRDALGMASGIRVVAFCVGNEDAACWCAVHEWKRVRGHVRRERRSYRAVPAAERVDSRRDGLTHRGCILSGSCAHLERDNGFELDSNDGDYDYRFHTGTMSQNLTDSRQLTIFYVQRPTY